MGALFIDSIHLFFWYFIMGTCSITTMDVRGQLTNPYQVLDQALADIFVANFSQSVLYKGSVSSMVYLIQKNADKPELLVTETQRTLNDYLMRFFDAVSIVVSIVDPIDDATETDKRFTLRLEITFTVNGVKYDAAHLAFIENSKFQRIINEAKGV